MSAVLTGRMHKDLSLTQHSDARTVICLIGLQMVPGVINEHATLLSNVEVFCSSSTMVVPLCNV